VVLFRQEHSVVETHFACLASQLAVVRLDHVESLGRFLSFPDLRSYHDSSCVNHRIVGQAVFIQNESIELLSAWFLPYRMVEFVSSHYFMSDALGQRLTARLHTELFVSVSYFKLFSFDCANADTEFVRVDIR